MFVVFSCNKNIYFTAISARILTIEYIKYKQYIFEVIGYNYLIIISNSFIQICGNNQLYKSVVRKVIKNGFFSKIKFCGLLFLWNFLLQLELHDKYL